MFNINIECTFVENKICLFMTIRFQLKNIILERNYSIERIVNPKRKDVMSQRISWRLCRHCP